MSSSDAVITATLSGGNVKILIGLTAESLELLHSGGMVSVAAEHPSGGEVRVDVLIADVNLLPPPPTREDTP